MTHATELSIFFDEVLEANFFQWIEDILKIKCHSMATDMVFTFSVGYSSEQYLKSGALDIGHSVIDFVKKAA